MLTNRDILEEDRTPLMFDSEEDKEDDKDHGHDDGDDHHHPTVNQATRHLLPISANVTILYLLHVHLLPTLWLLVTGQYQAWLVTLHHPATSRGVGRLCNSVRRD